MRFGTRSRPLCSTLDAEDRLVTALEFGSMFSSIAYCFPDQTDLKVAAIVEWPSGHFAAQIPTLISYNAIDAKRFM